MARTLIYSGIRRALEPDGSMYAVLQRASRSYLPWAEFLKLDLPPEMTPEETWDLLQRIDHSVGIDIPVPDLEGNEYWYVRTHELADSFSRLQCLCRVDSELHRRLMNTRSRRIIVRTRIDETIAAGLLDGLDINTDEAYELLQLDRHPRTPEQRIIRNTLAAIDRLGELTNEPFTPALFERLRRMLLVGVEPGSWASTKARRGLIHKDYPEAMVRQAAEIQLRRISDYANHTTGDDYDHPAFRALLLPDLFRVYRPLPDMNSQVGRLAYRLYTLKAGLPVLGMIALSRVKLRWKDGALRSAIVRTGPEEYFQEREREGANLTDYATMTVHMALQGLADLEEAQLPLEQRDEELRTLLEQDPDLNHRQRSILGRALRRPDAEFRIAYHKTNHRIVYATARADLLELVDRGYLEQRTRGRAFVFVPRPGLRDLIENAGTSGGATLTP
jgi:Fic family protein